MIVLMSESAVKRKLVSLRFLLHIIGKAGADQNAKDDECADAGGESIMPNHQSREDPRVVPTPAGIQSQV